MYIEFWGKIIISLGATVLVIFRAVRAVSKPEHSPIRRLRFPIVVAITFFLAMLITARTSLMATALAYDPSLPLWLIVFSAKLLLLYLFARKLYLHALPEMAKARFLLLIALFLLATAAETVFILPAAMFVASPQYDNHGVTMQTLQVTCIPSSLSTICKLYGDPVSEYEATRLVKTLLIGSLTSHSVSGCRNLGFSQASYSRLPLKDVLAENLPFILTTDTGVSGIEHAFGVVGYHNDTLYFADPLRGLVKIGTDEFQKQWAGKIIRLGPREGAKQVPLLGDFSPELLASSETIF